MVKYTENILDIYYRENLPGHLPLRYIEVPLYLMLLKTEDKEVTCRKRRVMDSLRFIPR